LAGRVCDSGEPLWILGAAQSTRTPQVALAHEIGLAGAFIFPVMAAGGKPIGVLAFNGRSVQEPDGRLLQAVRSIGEQLGQFLQRRQTDDGLRRSEERFRRLTELSADWYWEQDANFRFTHIVGNGMADIGDMLGKTLWELPGIALGDDRWVAHKSEVRAQWSFCDFECAVELPDGQFSYHRVSGEPLYDAAGAFSGFHGTGLDITQRRRAEIALQRAAAR
jgi:PAS domain S-box-containing protein